MKLFEEFNEYEKLWEDSITKDVVDADEYIISYRGTSYNIAAENDLQKYRNT